MSNDTVAIDNHIPDVDITFLPTDSFNIVLDVVKSNKFYPLWLIVTGKQIGTYA